MSNPNNMEFSGQIRWRTSLVLLVSVVIAYFDRLNITLALPKIAEDFSWTTDQQGEYGGILFGIFYAAYGLANVLLSGFGEKLGPKKSLMIIVVLWSTFTAMGAFFGQILSLFIASRILLGFGEGIHFPMMNLLTKAWFPDKERSRANGLWIAGIFVATILAPIILVPVIENYGWRTMFYLLSIAGLVITLPLIYFFIHNTPKEHPTISQQEVDYIKDNQEPELESKASFFKLLGSKVYLLAFTAGIFNNMAAHGLTSWLPTYFTEGRGLPFEDLSYAVSVPYVFSIFGILLWSFLGDKTNKRVILASIGFLLAGAFTYFAVSAENINMTVVILSGAIFAVTAYTTSEFAIVQKILPKPALAKGVGIYNGLTTLIGGGLGPVIVGQVVSRTESWTNGVLCLVVFCILATIVLLILSRVLKY